jgi:hypothetical protein
MRAVIYGIDQQVVLIKKVSVLEGGDEYRHQDAGSKSELEHGAAGAAAESSKS